MSFLRDFFISKTENLPTTQNTRNYIVSTFTNTMPDLSKKSLTLTYFEAKFTSDFKKFQETADYILIFESIFPESLNNANKEYYYNLARICFYKCYLLIDKKWLLFEELSDNFPNIINYLQRELKNNSKPTFPLTIFYSHIEHKNQ